MDEGAVLLLAAGPEGAADLLRVLLGSVARAFFLRTLGLGLAFGAFFGLDSLVFVIGAWLDAVEDAIPFAVGLVLAVG